MIYMADAPLHQDMYDLKMNAPADIRGEFKPINTNVPGIQISEHLPKLASIMDKLGPLRSIFGSPSSDHDSFICYTGRTVKNQPQGGWPSLGSSISKILGSSNNSVPPFIGLAPLCMRITNYRRLAQIIGVCQKPYTPFYLTRTL